MSGTESHDVAIVGGGIVGLATARALAERRSGRIVLLEAEAGLARHQTGNNSGVVHSGLYYRPGSLKARNCTEGRKALYRFCRDHGVRYEKCGKLVVAVESEEIPRLVELERRGRENGLGGIRRVRAEELGEFEPHVRGLAGLWVPQTGIVDFPGMATALATELERAGGEIRTGARVTAIRSRPAGFVLETENGEVETRNLVNCAGLQSDRVARMSGLTPRVRIVPFRGEYYRLADGRESLVRNLIYPVPDPRFPFLGVHFTRRVDGIVEAGPNAVLALSREGYSWGKVSPADLAETLGFGGFWRMAARYWSVGVGEAYRSLYKPAFVQALRKLIPDLAQDDLVPAGAGVRAQAVTPEGRLLDDFEILEAERMLHVLNAPSPAATASLSIGNSIAERAAGLFRR